MGNFAEQWEAVKGAPLLYIPAAIGLFLLSLGLVHFLYRHRIDGLKEELDRERRENDRLRSQKAVPSPERKTDQPLAPEPKKVSIKLPTKSASPPAEDAHRMFVGSAVTPRFFDDLFDEHTEHQANKLVAPYLGKWMRLSGAVSRVTHNAQSGWQVTIKTDPKITAETTILNFGDRDGGLIEVLHKGDPITVEGRIDDVSAVWLRLEDCRLV